MINRYLILALTLIIGFNSCQEERSKNHTSEVYNDFEFTTTDQAQSCSPRILKRNTENGLILLSENQLNEIEQKPKS